MIFVITGIILLIIGLILIIALWPFIGGMGVNNNMEDIPENPEEGQTYTFFGTVEKAHTKGDYTIMVIEFNDGEIGWVAEGEFNEGESVLFNVKCTDKDDWKDAGIGEDDPDDEDPDWDQWFESGKDASEDEIKDYIELVEESQKETGVEMEVTKPPMIGGIIGLILLIVGLILLVIGLIKKSKLKKTAAPPSDQAS
jgi:hypothetical protein